MKRYDLIQAIGHTPLVELKHLSPKPGVHIYAKLEGYNPSGSVKDRIAKYMIESAESRGDLTPEKTILEATSGNTGIALALIGFIKGYKVKIVVPGDVSREAKQLLQVYGAEIVFSDADKGANGAVELANRIVREGKDYYMPYQYGNEANPRAHFETTGAEILEALPRVDVFVAGLGTGGTLTGVGRRLKEANPQTRVIGVVPHPGDEVRGLRSLEDGFVPPVLDLSVLDSRVVVESKDAFAKVRDLARKEGIFGGISSGAVVHCAVQLAARMNSGNIVVLSADGGWKYLSTGLWTDDPATVEARLGNGLKW